MLLLIVLLLGVATICKGNEDASDNSDQRSFTAEQDSLASDLGTIMGAQFRSQLESLSENAASKSRRDLCGFFECKGKVF